MHTLFTTPAYVLTTYPHGESSLVYKLLTKSKGLLYAHGQSVRELKSRNRYALQVGHKPIVTLVRGRETWRITSAQHNVRDCEDTRHVPALRRVLQLAGRYTPVEDVVPETFEDMELFSEALCRHQEHSALIEVIAVLRLLDRLGYVARPIEEQVIMPFLGNDAFEVDTLRAGEAHKALLVARVNTALEEAK